MNLAELIRYLGHLAGDFHCDSRNALEDLRDISLLIDGRLPYYDGHLQRVAHCATTIAHTMGLSHREMISVEIASLLHDLGKLMIDNGLLLKRSGLTEAEYRMICQHSILGYYMLEGFNGFDDALLGIKHHHENYDGSGYPSAYVETQIPLCSRIIAVADAYDAMTSERPYRHAFDRKRAIDELQKKAGSQFDPMIVEVFLRN